MHFIKTILFLSILILSTAVFAKGKWNIGIGSTHGFSTSELYLWEYKVEKTMSHGVFFKLGYEFKIYKNFNLAITPGFEQHYDEIGVNNINIETFSYNFNLPIDLFYYFKKRLRFQAGVSVQDYRQFEEVALERSYNARLNLNLGISYHYHKNWAAELSYSTILSDRRDSFLIRNYPHHFSIGVLYRFNFNKAEE